MENYYKILGLNPSATPAEIRRAYRVLARRYHPDMNPGKSSEEKFKKISEGYRILKDSEKRKEYDRNLEIEQRINTDNKFKSIQRAQEEQKRRSASERYYKAQKDDYDKLKQYNQRRTYEGRSGLEADSLMGMLKDGATRLSKKVNNLLYEKEGKTAERKRPANKQTNPKKRSGNLNPAAVNQISIIEISVTISDVINGVKKTVEIEEPDGVRRIRVSIPAGVRSGSVVRMRSTNNPEEEIVLVIRVARHPFMHIDGRGLIVDIPITVQEAMKGASITVPTLDEDQILLKIPKGTQSGTELRARGKGIKEKEGKGDLIYRMFVQVPTGENNESTEQLAEQMSNYYQNPVRKDFPTSLLDAARI